MGVKGFWQLVLPCGKIINVESLQGKILAVDVSIWLNKLAKASQSDQSTDNNRYLLLIFNRICKLLYYGIKPVFVFDGGVPDVKKKTLIDRKKRRIEAENLEHRTQNQITKNKMQMKALEFLRMSRGSEQKKNKQNKKANDDIFQIASSSNGDIKNSASSSKEELMRLIGENVQQEIANIKDLDVESDEFKSLPVEVQHEILMELKELLRRRSRYTEGEREKLPEEATNFSDFQLKNLIKTGKITNQIDSLRKEMNSGISADFIETHSEMNFKTNKITSKKNISEDNKKYILVKKKRSDEGNALFNTSLFDEATSSDSNQRSKGISLQRMERIPANLNALNCFNSTNYRPGRLLSESSDDELSPDDEEKETSSPQKSTVDEIEYMSSSSTDDELTIENEEFKTESDSEVTTSETSFEENTASNYEKILENTRNEYEINNRKDEKLLPEKADEVNHQEIISEKLFIKSDSNNICPVDSIAVSNKSLDERSEVTRNGFVKNKDVDNNSTVGESEDASNLLPMEEVGSMPCVKESDSSVNLEKNVISIVSPKQNNVSLAATMIGNKTQEKVIPEKAVNSLRDELLQQREMLESKKRTHTMIAKEVSNEMYDEVQDLLEMFGIPFIVSPTEAEAQCAFLEMAQLVNGCITDDGDTFLFGASTVYKNFFNQDKHIEMFTSAQLHLQLNLTREKLIALAFLTGSDYTPGLPGVGAITGMEVLQEFDSPSSRDALSSFKDWILAKHFKPTHVLSEKTATKLKNMRLPRNFNSDEVWDAYLHPDINQSKEAFEWGIPDQDRLRKFTKDQFHWNKARCDDVLNPVLKKCISRRKFGHDKTLDAYFPRIVEETTRKVSSKRLNRVLQKIKEQTEGKTDNSADAK